MRCRRASLVPELVPEGAPPPLARLPTGENESAIMIEVLRQFSVFLAVSLAVYFALVVVSLIVGGNGVSCDRNCTGTQEWLANAYPFPMLVAGILAVAIGMLAARRWSR